jgi:uncharacterized membrane protein
LAKGKTREQLESELRVLKKARFSEGSVQIALSLIRWGAIVLIARYVYLSISTLSGHSTFADIGINFLASVHISVAIAWGASVGGVLYGVNQRKLRKDTVEHFHGRIKELETMIDPSRSTSNLTPRGDTRPEDKL